MADSKSQYVCQQKKNHYKLKKSEFRHHTIIIHYETDINFEICIIKLLVF